MAIWLLRPREKASPWRDPWHKAHGFIIRAETEEDARAMATQSHGDETGVRTNAWLNSRLSTCIELTSDGETGVILCDYRGG